MRWKSLIIQTKCIMHGYIESYVDQNSYLFPSIHINTLLSDKILITNNFCENYSYMDGKNSHKHQSVKIIPHAPTDEELTSE